jgi:hypothetical protein
MCDHNARAFGAASASAPIEKSFLPDAEIRTASLSTLKRVTFTGPTWAAWNHHPKEVLRVACKVVASVSISARYSSFNQQ